MANSVEHEQTASLAAWSGYTLKLLLQELLGLHCLLMTNIRVNRVSSSDLLFSDETARDLH